MWQALIIVLMLILVSYLVYYGLVKSEGGMHKAHKSRSKRSAGPARQPVQACGMPGQVACLPCGGNLSAGNLKAVDGAQNSSYDAQAYSKLAENFEVCGTATDSKSVADCVCGTEEGEFVKNDYGAPGLDYGSFVMSQAVDDQVIVNHANYIKNRKQFGTSGEFTGRTYSPDSHDSYDPIAWQGLRRPEYVNRCNPTQVPDIDTNLYKGNRSFCFKT